MLQCKETVSTRCQAIRDSVVSLSSSTGDGRQQFREGYRRCQEEVLRFLGCTAAVQPHVAERLWQQLTHQTIDASRQDAHTPVDLLDNDSTSRKPPRPTGNEAHLPRLTLTVEPLEPRPVTSRISLPRTPCSPDPIPPHHAPYAHTHWKKCLRPRVGACFWRPW